MKYFILGLHSTGKQEVVDILEKLGIKCGKLFSNIIKPSESLYNSYNYELYSDKDIIDVFENNAYVFIHELDNNQIPSEYKKYEGLSKYTVDQNDVFVLSPDQLLNIIPNSINDNVCFIWMDGTTNNRKSRFRAEKRLYNFTDRDYIEKRDIQSFVKCMYGFDNSRVIYFNDEEPCRVATIIYSLIQHPELLPLYEKNFN